MSFRTEIKRDIAAKLFEIEVNNQEEELERNEVGLRLLSFFEYEQDPEFVAWFTEFCHRKKWEREKEEER